VGRYRGSREMKGAAGRYRRYRRRWGGIVGKLE